MSGPDLPASTLQALHAAAREGVLTRGRSGFYPGFTTGGSKPIPTQVVAALQRRGLLERPDRFSGMRRITEKGRALVSGQPPASQVVAPIRSYID